MELDATSFFIFLTPASPYSKRLVQLTIFLLVRVSKEGNITQRTEGQLVNTCPRWIEIGSIESHNDGFLGYLANNFLQTNCTRKLRMGMKTMFHEQMKCLAFSFFFFLRKEKISGKMMLMKNMVRKMNWVYLLTLTKNTIVRRYKNNITRAEEMAYCL